MFTFIKKLFNKKKTYKCVVFIDNSKEDKLVDAFEIEEYSMKKAYEVAEDVLKLKYPGSGLDIRIFEK